MQFSIITITKHNPEGFQKTKQLVESQSYSGFEWIIVDGEKDPDKGIYDAMNKGIDRAKGDYLIFMNAGDEFAATDILDKLSGFTADFIYGDSIEDGFVKKAKPLESIKGGMVTHHQAMVYKRSVIGKLRYDLRYNIAADYKFTLEFLRQAKTFQKADFPICIFEGGGVSVQYASKARCEEQAIRRELGIFSPLSSLRQWLALTVKKLSHKLYLKLRSYSV